MISEPPEGVSFLACADGGEGGTDSRGEAGRTRTQLAKLCYFACGGYFRSARMAAAGTQFLTTIWSAPFGWPLLDS